MEVIKIPREHVDACLFFRPGGEDGELRGRDTVLRVGRTVGGERGDGRQMLEKRLKQETDQGERGWRPETDGMNKESVQTGTDRHPLLDIQ